jgi:YD repeat-containing protein
MNRPWMRVSGWGARFRILFAAAFIAAGALITTTGNAGTVTYTYDANGRITSRVTTNAAGDVVTVSYGHDNANNRTSLTVTTVDPIPPSVPTGLTGTVISVSQINLSWTASTDGGSSGIAGYRVRRNGTLIGSPSGTSYSDTTVVGSTTYQYTVSAFDGHGNESGQSSPISKSTPDITAPSAPTGLTGYAVDPNWVNLSWNTSTDSGGSGLAGYEIFRGGSLIGSSLTNSYADHTAAASTSYSYTVKAYDGAGNRSASSASFGITTPNAPDTTPPTVPAGLGASAPASGTVNLSWSASTDPGTGATGVVGYRVYRNGSYLGVTSSTSYADNTTVGSTSYQYRVLAYDGAGNQSAQSSAVSVTTPDTIAPSTPTGLSASAPTSGQVNLSWSASTDSGGSGLAGYRIYRGGSLLGATSATSYTDTTTVANTNYSYQVRAYDVANNNSALSPAVGVTTPDTIAPGAPGNPTFSAITHNAATASWGAASDNVGVTGYRYSLNGGASWTTLGNVLSVNVTGLALGTSYSMLLQARDAAGNWGPNSSGGFTTSTYYHDQMAWNGGEFTGPTYWMYGYLANSFGSISPTTTSNGKTITIFRAYLGNDGSGGALLEVTGFNGNPGQGWLQSISGPMGTLNGANAHVFLCQDNNTRCWWQWSTWTGTFYGPGTLTIVHQ